MIVFYLLLLYAKLYFIYSGGNSDLIGGFADFSSPAASASLPTSTGKHAFTFLSSSKRTMLSWVCQICLASETVALILLIDFLIHVIKTLWEE